MHSTQHAGDEFVDAIAFLNKWDKRSNATFVVRATSEMRKDELLEGINLILQGHQIRDRLIALVRVIDRLQTDVLLILKGSCQISLLL